MADNPLPGPPPGPRDLLDSRDVAKDICEQYDPPQREVCRAMVVRLDLMKDMSKREMEQAVEERFSGGFGRGGRRY